MTRSGEASPEALVETLAGLSEARADLVARPVREIASVLGRVGARFSDERDPLRARALEGLPAEAALSGPMARVVLDGMARDWTTDRLNRLLDVEFADPSCLDGPVTTRGRTAMVIGPALCVQISSGGVPGVGVNAILRSLLVKGPTLVKPGAGDSLLTRLFAEALAEEDGVLGRALGVVYWPGSDVSSTRVAVAAADVVVAYGADETVGAVRELVPVTTRFVAYHHRFGVALVGRDVTPEEVDGVVGATARAVALFEHRGCVCPHLVFVEEGGPIDPGEFAEQVADHLGRLEGAWPPPPRGPAEAARAVQAVGTLEMLEASGALRLLRSAGASWTVAFTPTPVDAPVVPGRSVQVRGVADLADVAAILGSAARHLQSVGYAGIGERRDALTRSLGRAGASRLTPLERMSFPPAWWVHDGRGGLDPLVRRVEVED